MDEWKTIKPKAPRIGPKAPVPSATPPVLRPKEKEKHSSAQHRRDLEFVQVQKKRDEGEYSKRRRSNIAVIIVEIIFIGSFLFYCLLLNHSFQTNPNSVTNCFQLFSFYYNFTTTLFLRRYFDF